MKKIEYEVRVLEVNKEELIQTLEALGANKEADYDQKRYTYSFKPAVYEKWIRLRTDGIKTTLTIKEIQSRRIGGTKETEIEVSDFETTNRMMKELGYEHNNYQENKRTRYYLDGVEIDIDTWPRIPTWVEIEGESEKQVRDMVTKLGLKEGKVTTLDPQGVYRDIYGIDIGKIEVLKFE